MRLLHWLKRLLHWLKILATDPQSVEGLQLRIEALKEHGFGDENPMVQALQRQRGMKLQEKIKNGS